MHIDQKKLVQLIADSSGVDSGKVETWLSDLVKEIRDAISEGEAYELEGFGLFTGIGNTIKFIPSKELEIEINYKYVGMEPVNIDVPKPQKDVRVPAKTEEEDPFEPETPGPEKWGIDTYSEGNADAIFGAMFSEESTQKNKGLAEKEAEEKASEKKETASKKKKSSKKKTASKPKETVVPKEEEEKQKPKPEKSEEQNLADSLSEALNAPDEPEEVAFEDPFADVIHSSKPDEKSKPGADKSKGPAKDDVVPVIRNVASVKTKTEEKVPKKEPKKAKSKQAADPVQLPKSLQRNSSVPVAFWILIIAIIVVVSGVVAWQLGIFNTKENLQTATIAQPPVVQNNESAEQLQTAAAQNQIEQEQAGTPVPDEPETTAPVVADSAPPQTTVLPESSSGSGYGMYGEIDAGLENPYTVVLHSLREQTLANATARRLRQDGLRAIVTPFSSDVKGDFWRVSVGQFKSLEDAVDAINELGSPYNDSFFLIKLNQ